MRTFIHFDDTIKRLVFTSDFGDDRESTRLALQRQRIPCLTEGSIKTNVKNIDPKIKKSGILPPPAPKPLKLIL